MRRFFIGNKKNLGFLLVIITSLCYGAMPALTQMCYKYGLSVNTTLTTRYIFSSALIWLLVFAAKKDRHTDRSALKLLVILGIVSFVCTFCMSASYRYIPGAIASVLVFLYFVYVNIIEVIIGREKIYLSRIICLIFAAAGILMVVDITGTGGSLSAKGLILAILAGVFYGVLSMGMGSQKLQSLSAEVVMGYIYIVPTVALITKCLIEGDPVLPSQPAQWVFTLILAVGPGFMASICFCAAVKIIGASTASVVNTSEPVIAYFIGIFIMADKITWSATLGGGIIVIAILFLNFSEKKRSSLS